jgi:hypothetical protein
MGLGQRISRNVPPLPMQTLESASHNGTWCYRNRLMAMEAIMARDPDANEWGMLKGYFAALADYEPAQRPNRLRPYLMSKFVGALGDWIARSARNSNNRKAKTLVLAKSPISPRSKRRIIPCRSSAAEAGFVGGRGQPRLEGPTRRPALVKYAFGPLCSRTEVCAFPYAVC